MKVNEMYKTESWIFLWLLNLVVLEKQYTWYISWIFRVATWSADGILNEVVLFSGVGTSHVMR
jgi:hypothetical protein